jgi:hypothetical protein
MDNQQDATPVTVTNALSPRACKSLARKKAMATAVTNLVIIHRNAVGASGDWRMGDALLAALVVANLLVASSGSVGAQTPAKSNGPVAFLSGEQLLNYCGGNDPATRDGCIGFTMGVADAAAEASAAGSFVGPFCVCRPEEVTGSQVVEEIVQFLEAHPEERQSRGAAGLAIQALAKAWPCP